MGIEVGWGDNVLVRSFQESFLFISSGFSFVSYGRFHSHSFASILDP